MKRKKEEIYEFQPENYEKEKVAKDKLGNPLIIFRPKAKDGWDITGILLRPLGGLLAGMAIALIGLIGSNFLHQKEANDLYLRLSIEQMDKRYQSENKLRSDMFRQIFSSFIERPKPTEDVNSKLQEIEHDLLNIELLTRNFHETLDIKPLYYGILFEILDLRQKAKNEQVDKYLNRLFRITKRVTRKQLEILKEVGNSIPLTIHYDDICLDYTSTSQSLSSNKCEKNGYEKNVILSLENKLQREFKIQIKIAYPSIEKTYPSWKQVKVKIEATIPNSNKKDKVGNEKKEFWVSCFDFPMIDNTFLSKDERYSIVLNSFDDKNKEINLTLVYFPASYGGLKERSFYHHKALNYLDKVKLIKDK